MKFGSDFKELAHDIASRRDERAASHFIVDHPAPSDPAQIDPYALRLWGDVAYTAREYSGAARVYSYLTEVEPDFHWPFFQLGRIRFEAGDHTGAASMFSKAVSLAPDFAWSWYELSRCYFQQKHASRLIDAVAGFAAAQPVVLNEYQCKVVASIAHYLFDEHYREECFQLYKLLVNQGYEDDLVQTRHAEYFIAKGDFDAGIRLLEPRHQSSILGMWGLRSLARAYSRTGNLENAASIFSTLVAQDPKNEHFLRDYLRVLHKQDKSAEAITLLAKAKISSRKSSYERLHITHLCEMGDYAGLVEILEAQPQYGGAGARHDILRAVNALANRKKDYPAASALIGRFIARFGSNPDIIVSQLNVAFATRAWPAAAGLLAQVDEATYQAHLELRVKRFEYYCFIGALPEARTAMQGLEPIADLPKHFMLPVMRYFAEIKDWDAVYRLGMQLLDLDFDFEQAGYIVFRAIRKTGLHVPALRQIEQIEELDRVPSLRHLRAIVMEDMIRNDHMIEDLIDDPHVDHCGPIQQRLLFKKLVFQSRSGKPLKKKKFAIYFCTNETYLCPTLVALTSLVESNRDIVRWSDIFIVVADDAYPAARKVCAKLSQSLQINIQLKSRADILDSSALLKVDYGLFTGGHSLSEAAYYRIYFARLLQAECSYQRALYIDSDTIVQGSLHDLFAGPARGPLAARVEDDRPEVAATVRANNLDPGMYFNSGILLFDMRHKALASALDRTIHAVQFSRDTLMFQDQCALNIGFKGAFVPLDGKFNLFVRPNSSQAASEATILHFVDRPKPWDPAYAGDACRIWYSSWHRLSMQIGGDDAMKLYNLSNKT